MCDCVRACVCVLSPSVRPWLGRRREGDFKTGRVWECQSPWAVKRGEDFALSEHCQNVVRTLSERCQNAVRTARSLSEQVWELHKPGCLFSFFFFYATASTTLLSLTKSLWCVICDL